METSHRLPDPSAVKSRVTTSSRPGDVYRFRLWITAPPSLSGFVGVDRDAGGGGVGGEYGGGGRVRRFCRRRAFFDLLLLDDYLCTSLSFSRVFNTSTPRRPTLRRKRSSTLPFKESGFLVICISSPFCRTFPPPQREASEALIKARAREESTTLFLPNRGQLPIPCTRLIERTDHARRLASGP